MQRQAPQPAQRQARRAGRSVGPIAGRLCHRSVVQAWGGAPALGRLNGRLPVRSGLGCLDHAWPPSVITTTSWACPATPRRRHQACVTARLAQHCDRRDGITTLSRPMVRIQGDQRGSLRCFPIAGGRRTTCSGHAAGWSRRPGPDVRSEQVGCGRRFLGRLPGLRRPLRHPLRRRCIRPETDGRGGSCDMTCD